MSKSKFWSTLKSILRRNNVKNFGSNTVLWHSFTNKMFQRWNISTIFHNGHFSDTNLLMGVSATPFGHTCQELCLIKFFGCQILQSHDLVTWLEKTLQQSGKQNADTYLQPLYFHSIQNYSTVEKLSKIPDVCSPKSGEVYKIKQKMVAWLPTYNKFS